jgi:hypothetical protein
VISLTEIIFAKPVHKYDSYTDFWRLVELSGFPIISVSDIDITKYQIIVTSPMNGDYQEHFVGNLAQWEETGEITGGQLKRQKDSGLPRLAHLIIWNLERPSGSGSVPEYALRSKSWIDDRLCDEVWVSDPSLADETMLRYVSLGSDYGLGELGDQKKYDFTHQSVIIPRRANIYKHFGEGQIGPNCWPWDNPSRDDVLKSSRFALNVHQDNWPFCEPLRLALFAAYGLPVISETLANGYPYGEAIHQIPYHNLVDSLKGFLKDDYGRWAEMGLKLQKLMCEDLQFGRVVRQAISESAGIGWR